MKEKIANHYFFLAKLKRCGRNRIMLNKYISFNMVDRNEMGYLAKLISAFQNEGVTFRIERDAESIHIYFR